MHERVHQEDGHEEKSRQHKRPTVEVVAQQSPCRESHIILKSTGPSAFGRKAR